MQSVCEETRRSENLSVSDNARGKVPRQFRDDRGKELQRCSCKLKAKSSRFGLVSKCNWKLVFETESTSHHSTCPLFTISAITTTAKFRIASCGTFLAGAVEASISITRGAGGFSISPVLRGARVVPYDSPAFALVSTHPFGRRRSLRSKRELEESMDANIHEIELLFQAGKASPYDVDLQGNTLFHVRVTLFSMSSR